MKRDSFSDDPNILEAVDNLSSMADLDLEEFATFQGERSEQQPSMLQYRWLDTKDTEGTLQAVKGTFKTIHKYLQHIYSQEPHSLKDIEMQRGIRSILQLAKEAAQKIDQCSQILGNNRLNTSVKESTEFKELETFYEKKILEKFEQTIDEEDIWKEAWEEEHNVLDITGRGLKSLEMVTRDRDYELFYILKEDGTKFYNKNLIRHTRLVANFDWLVGELQEKDPLIRSAIIIDKEALLSACALKKSSLLQINELLKKAKHHLDAPLIEDVHKALMALLLASNPRNLVAYTTGKSCSHYFADFTHYFREIVGHVDYKAIIDNAPQDPDHFFYRMITLVHTLGFYYFIHKIDLSEMVSFFAQFLSHVGKDHHAMRSTTNGLSFWNGILDLHEDIYSLLKRYPSGPLFKAIDILYGEEEDFFFDPYTQSSRSRTLYELSYLNKNAMCLRFPAPIKQKVIDKAIVLDEFKACLYHLSDRQQQEKLFLINLQDRTSWKEFARCKIFEDFRMRAEFKKQIYYMNLPKDTAFYFQSDLYLSNQDAAEFTAQLLAQVMSGQECGFCFPAHIKMDTIGKFAYRAIHLIHEHFFSNKQQLSRKNRLDFIEIFYHLLTLQMIDAIAPDYIGFMCKDGIDLSNVASVSFYAFVKLLQKNTEWKEEEKECLEAMLFVPALVDRGRVVDLQRLSRAISMISVVTSVMEMHKKRIIDILRELFSERFLAKISVSLVKDRQE